MTHDPAEPLKLLPLPKNITFSEGTFAVTPEKVLYHNKFRLKPLLMPIFSFVREYMKFIPPFDPIQDSLIDAHLVKNTNLLFWTSEDIVATVNAEFNTSVSIPPHGYILQVTPIAVKLQAHDLQGFRYGVQTLNQILEQVLLSLVAKGGTAKSFEISCLTITDAPSIFLRGLHVDLKDIMYRFEYLKELWAILPQYKYNTVLVEYGDKFPFADDLHVVRHRYCLTEDQLDDLLKVALRNDVETIPLIPTWNNFSFVLKHAAFAAAREFPDNLDALCPRNPDSLKLVKKVIRQVCAKHSQSKYLHIGGDHVLSQMLCPTCKAYVTQHGESKLYADYINNIAQLVRAERKIPIMWADTLLKYPDTLDTLDKDIIIMYSDETSCIPVAEDFPTGRNARTLSLPSIETLQKKGFKVIGASSPNSSASWTFPTYARLLPNIACFARCIAESHVDGIIVRPQADCDSTLETQWHAILWGADLCWHSRPMSPDVVSDFDARFNATYFGCPIPISTNITYILTHEIDRPPAIVSSELFQSQETALSQLFSGFQELRRTATKAKDTLRFLELGLKRHLLVYRLLAGLTHAEDVFLLWKQGKREFPLLEELQALSQSFTILEQMDVDYALESTNIYENTEEGILYPGEWQSVYQCKQYLPHLTQAIKAWKTFLGNPRKHTDEILQAATQRRVG